MGKNRKKVDAVGILHRRYIGDDAERKASLQAERVNADVARTICELRKEAGLTQKELADLIVTTQSVISRLEDADYDGHSLSMLSRIAKALNRHLSVKLVPKIEENATIRFVFQEVLKGLRRERGLKIDQFSKKVDIAREDVVALERDTTYRPSPLILHKLSKFYNISNRKLAYLAGAVTDIPANIQEEASKFAAKSESFSNLTDEERKTLDEFVKFLKTEVQD